MLASKLMGMIHSVCQVSCFGLMAERFGPRGLSNRDFALRLLGLRVLGLRV